MRRVRLTKLEIVDWRGQTRTIYFSDRTIIRGVNGLGKSSIFEAFLWLTVGVDSFDRTNYDLFDHLRPFTPENAIPAIAAATFDVDGVEYVFKRSAKQKWYRPRGESEYKKEKSDEYLYYIDGLAVSAKVYRERIESLFAPIDKLKLMLNIRYYQMLDWKKLRKHFSDIVGEVKPEELKGDYSILDSLLNKYEDNVEMVKEKLKQDLTPLNKDSLKLANEIEGMQQMMPDVADVPEAKAKIEALKAQLKEIENGFLDANAKATPYIEKRNAELEAIRTQRETLRMKAEDYFSKRVIKLKPLRESIAEIDSLNADIARHNQKIEARIADANKSIVITEQQIQFLNDELVRLRAKKDEIKARVFDEKLLICPTCGHEYGIEESDKIRNDFYMKRENDLRKVVELGVNTKDKWQQQLDLKQQMLQQVEDLKAEIKTFLSASDLRIQLSAAENEIPDFESTEEYKKLSSEIDEMQRNLTQIPVFDTSELVERRNLIMQQMSECQNIVSKEQSYIDGERKINIKQSALSKMNVEKARLEGLIAKCIEREREWAAIVRERANRNLRYCSVEMTELKKSGEIDDVCSISVDGVDTSVTNTAKKTVAGIDIANAFMTHAGVNLPIFIDNAEHICKSNIPPFDNQMILMYMDENVPTLTVS